MKYINSLTLCAILVSIVIQAQTIKLSDNADLTLDLASNATITGVGLKGIAQTKGIGGGFFLRQPNTTLKVAMTGSVVPDNGKYKLELTSSLNASVKATITEGNGYIEVEGYLENKSGTDRGLWLGFNLPVNTLGWKWGQSLSVSPTITTTAAGYGTDNNLVPIPTVWSDKSGIAMCIPPTNPCVFEVGADASGIQIQMAFGLSSLTAKFPSKAAFRFRIYAIDSNWGFRDALAKYYDWYPEYYTIRPEVMIQLDHHHDWINSNYVTDAIKLEEQVDPNAKQYMAYTKTSARIQGLTNVEAINTQQGYLEAINAATSIQHYEKNGAYNSKLMIEGREALKNSICYNPDNATFGIFSQAAGEIDFPHNCDPDLFKDAAHPNYSVYADMYLRKAQDLRKIADYQSIHWDRLGGWSTFLNYRKEHFAYLDHPLTFDQLGRVCIQTQFTNYELFDAYRLQLNNGGLFHEAAGMKEFSLKNGDNLPGGQTNVGMFFLSAVVEGGWQEGSFKENPLGAFDFERMSIGRKSYRISSGNIISRNEIPTIDAVKRALAQTTAYGFACPVQVEYFFPNDLLHKNTFLPQYSLYYLPEHKALWDKYEPANLAIRLAGWEPVTHATTTSQTVQLQRFGKGDIVYLTVWGSNPEASVEINLDAAALGITGNPAFSEIISNTNLQITKNGTSWKIIVPMEINMTRVIKIVSGTGLSIHSNAIEPISFEVYPNPTKGIVNIKYNKATDQKHTLSVINILGQKLYSTTLLTGTTTIDISKFGSQGIFLFQIMNENGTILETKKIVKR